MGNKEYEIGTLEYYERRERENKATINNLIEQNTTMRMALLLIKEWHEPSPNFQMNYGSNGMRDHFRRIAGEALE